MSEKISPLPPKPWSRAVDSYYIFIDANGDWVRHFEHADHILTAANAFPALVEALEKAMTLFGRGIIAATGSERASEAAYKTGEEIQAQAEAALALARGETER